MLVGDLIRWCYQCELVPYRPERKEIRWLNLKDDVFFSCSKCCSAFASGTHRLLMLMHMCMLPSPELCLCTALFSENTWLMQYMRHYSYMSLGRELWGDVYQEVLKEQIERKLIFMFLTLSLGWFALEVVRHLGGIICWMSLYIKGWLLSSQILNEPRATACLRWIINQPSNPGTVKHWYHGLHVARAPIPPVKLCCQTSLL